ncbi:MAG: sterol desaturase family protein [Acidobacteriota bacterium]
MRDPLVLATALFLAFGKFLLAGLWLSVIALAGLGRRRVYRVLYDREQLRDELLASWVIPLDGLAFVACLGLGLLRPAPPTWGASVLTFIVLYVFFEIWFYGTHRLMHTRLLWPIHAAHHRALVTASTSGLRFSLAEKLVLTLGSVGFAAAASHVLPVTLPGLLAFFVVYYSESILGHSNVEIMPAGLVRSPLGRVVGSTTFHALHHSRFSGHYGLTTPLLDYIFGTVFPDYPEVQERAARGEGLERLTERLTASPADGRRTAAAVPGSPPSHPAG